MDLKCISEDTGRLMTQKGKKSWFASKKKLYCKKCREVHSAKLDTEQDVQLKSEVKQKG